MQNDVARFIFHSMSLTVRALITFNAVHLNNPYKRLPRIYEKRRELDLVPRRVLVEPEKDRARGSSVSAVSIYISLCSSPISNSISTIFVFLLSPIASPFPAAVAEMLCIRYNKSWSPSTILPYESRSFSYITSYSLHFHDKLKTFISLFRYRCISFPLRFLLRLSKRKEKNTNN